ncbi:MAG TPA: diguanylate cyclase, partial [Burkholderiales bacterium]|nr:diguanylate cyclase [Burkholderiales bacterium]
MTLPREQAQLQESLERRLAELSEELKSANLRLQALEVSDPLTGLANRRRLSEALDTEWKRALRQQAPVGMVLVDIDLFKLYNGHYGHLGGDECLRRVARVLSAGVRGGGDLVARYGGDQFIMLLPGAGQEVATAVAERVRSGIEALRQPHVRAGRGVVTVSAGVAALHPSAGTQPGDLIEQAEAALYEAKKKGRNKVAGVPEKAGERARSAALSLLRMPDRAGGYGADEEARADPRPGAPVSVLVIEDSDLDAELIVRELRRGLAGLRWRRVQTEGELRAALDGEPWDAVICDYHLPAFGALPALAMVRARPDYLPFILVSGVVRDETAVEAMKQGVDDYVLKNNLARLAPAVLREVKANETRRANARAAESLRESESRFRQIAEAIRDVFILHDVDEHRVLYANPAFEAV